MTGGLTCSLTGLWGKWFKLTISHYSKSLAGFNVMEQCILFSGDIHPLPGPENSGTISVHAGNRQN